MFKFSIMALITCVIGLSFSVPESSAATQSKEKKSYSKSKITKTKKTLKSKKNKKKYKMKNKKTLKKGKKYRKSGGPDLRALTTQSPLSEFSETPDNGVNSIETKSDL